MSVTSPEFCAHAVAEIHRAYDLLEVIMRAVDNGDRDARAAHSQLVAVHESMARFLHHQEAELQCVRKSHRAATAKREELQKELLMAHEAFEELHVNEALTEEADDEHRRRADMLERENMELREECRLSNSERDKISTLEKLIQDAIQRDNTWRNRVTQLEQVADTAEAQARWERSQVQKDLEKVTTLEAENAKLRDQVQAQPQQMRETPTPVGNPKITPRGTVSAISIASTASAEKRLHMQGDEITRLRQLRKDLLAIQESFNAAQDGDDDESPRHTHMRFRCSFLTSQVQALLQHASQLEELLDSFRDSRLGSHPAPDVKRMLSIKQANDGSTDRKSVV